MLKKAIVTGGAVALLSTLAVGLPAVSYLRCGVTSLTESANDAMPLEWKLKQARQMIGDLKPEIQKNAKRIATEKIEVTRLEKELKETDQRLIRAEEDIERLTDDLNADLPEYTYAGHRYTSAQVKEDVGNRFKRFKTRQATADKLRQMLGARQASLTTAERRMDEMLSAKRQLEVEVENLQARLGALRLAETTSTLALDDSHLSNTRRLLDDIATNIDVQEETLNVDVEYFGEINLDEPNDEDLLDEIASYFGDKDQAEKQEDSSELVAIQLD
ncbi:MAG: hypothetical protein CBB71_19410 [Rhodopirellula sp. TMED11]|nr:MAG: hypothetical protein CBB71_19410 [Rhodopirellula sp. TMED11]